MNGEALNEGVNSMDDWHTVTETAEQTGIPAETVRRYVRTYGDYMRLKKEGRTYLIHTNSLDTVKKIRFLLDEGKQRSQVEDILQQTESLTIQTDDDEMNEYMLSLPQLHREMSRQIKEQSHIIQELQARVEQQEAHINERMDDQEQRAKARDERLMQTLNEIRETKKMIQEKESDEAAATEDKKPWWKFWS
ncbi:DUF3967 domain-containing protein [Alteribacillus iranensis]|uniref:DNA-binding transcriptional regulator, MerR family n=1 Tax=Alteribacillus iranensis TaxID=930128 RepID=A0A1I2FPB1_9BACI|nr:DUF3967 domain-containing protein [Alteribacillus iranensis]SFF06286.1 DNA-binding transcriptional regulator, MerR family [Alteribacillus iranensis]